MQAAPVGVRLWARKAAIYMLNGRQWSRTAFPTVGRDLDPRKWLLRALMSAPAASRDCALGILLIAVV